MRAKPSVDMIRQLTDVRVLLLSLVYIGLVISLSSNSAWVPQIVRGVVTHGSFVLIGIITAIPALFAIVAMPFLSASSDWRKERVWHLVAPIVMAALGWLFVAGFASPEGKFVGLILISVGTFAAQGIFWTLPPLFLAEKNRPVGMAMVNMIGLLGSIVGPFIFGVLKDMTHTFTVGLIFNGVALLIAAVCVLMVSWRSRAQASLAVGGEPAE
jgi:ACS family 4-hydroxyphenylacetate permease-like MFS transporter